MYVSMPAAGESPQPRFRKTARDALAMLEVTAEPCPQTLMRVLGLFARHAFVPYNIVMERRPRSLHLIVHFEDQDGASSDRLCAAAAAFPLVRSARLRRARGMRRVSPG